MPAASFASGIEFQMSLLLFVALAGYLLAYRINQSAVVGIILAGISGRPQFANMVQVLEVRHDKARKEVESK